LTVLKLHNNYKHHQSVTTLVLSLGIGLLLCPLSHAETLTALYQRVLANDPALSGAESQIDAANARVSEARAGLLPSIIVNAQANRTRYAPDNPSPLSTGSSHSWLTSRQFSEQLSQPLYKPGP
jgi:outer membrane protein TolC